MEVYVWFDGSEHLARTTLPRRYWRRTIANREDIELAIEEGDWSWRPLVILGLGVAIRRYEAALGASCRPPTVLVVLAPGWDIPCRWREVFDAFVDEGDRDDLLLVLSAFTQKADPRLQEQMS
ncbi:MAG: hypothetical protein HYU80_04185 [Candidatus Blackburnbacteria bacterium]|nr:hypothetical protein [Candidatus Blackburnbacteria bacterium]